MSSGNSTLQPPHKTQSSSSSTAGIRRLNNSTKSSFQLTFLTTDTNGVCVRHPNEANRERRSVYRHSTVVTNRTPLVLVGSSKNDVTSMEPAKVLDYVPIDMINAVRCVMTTFYEPEHRLIMEYLMHYPAISLDTLSERLRLEQKQVRRILFQLVNDRLVECKMDTEHNQANQQKTTQPNQHNQHRKNKRFFFVHYVNFVKVVMYRLDQLRILIDKMALDNAGTSRYTCKECGSSYTDFDADRLLNISRGTLECPNCELELESTVDESSEARQLSIRLNTNLVTLFTFLKNSLNIDLKQTLLCPPVITSLNKSESSALCLALKRNREVNGEIQNTTNSIQHNSVRIKYSCKEDLFNRMPHRRRLYPAWMLYSTVDGTTFLPHLLRSTHDGNNANKEDSDETPETPVEYRNKLSLIYDEVRSIEMKGVYSKEKRANSLALDGVRRKPQKRKHYFSSIRDLKHVKPWEMNVMFNWYNSASSRRATTPTAKKDNHLLTFS